MSLAIFTIQTVPVLKFLLMCGVDHSTGQQGVRLTLNGTVYFNNSVITISDIGTEATLTSPLVCLTDFRPCCRGRYSQDQPIVGEWHYPNGSIVPGNGLTEGKFDFFRTRGLNDGTVNLFRRNIGIASPLGRYCCHEIPDTSNISQRLCANLAPSEFSFVIDDGGVTPTVGQSYSLSCHVTGGTVSRYQWRKDGAVLQGQTTEVLSFSPLTLSDAGWYTCEITITAASENFTAVQNQTVIIQIPALSSVIVTISTAGANVDVVCIVELGPAVMESDISYLTVDTRLSRNGTKLALTGPIVSGTQLSYTFRIDSFERKNIGEYVCTVAVGPSQFSSPYVTGSAALTTKATIAFAKEVSVCSSEVARAVGLTVGVIMVIECLIAFTTLVVLCFKRKSSNTPKGLSDVVCREAQLYEDPDLEKLQMASSGQGNFEFELTRCPAYESVK